MPDDLPSKPVGFLNDQQRAVLMFAIGNFITLLISLGILHLDTQPAVQLQTTINAFLLVIALVTPSTNEKHKNEQIIELAAKVEEAPKPFVETTTTTESFSTTQPPTPPST